MELQLRGLCAVRHLTPVWECHYTTNEILVDHDLFIRAIVNILSNATERTPPGGRVFLVRPAAHVSNRCKSGVRPVVGRT